MQTPTAGPGRNAVILAVLGVLTGVVTWLFAPFQGPLVKAASEVMPGFSDAVDWSTLFIPGALFGLILGLWSDRALGRRAVWRPLLAALGGIVSWYLAIRVGADLATAGPELYEILAGPAAGALGAAIMAGAVVLCYREARSWRFVVPAFVLGTVVGFLLLGDWWLLFPLWQGAFAAILGWVYDRGAAAAPSSPKA